MSDQPGLQPSEEARKTIMYRPSADGGLGAAPEAEGDYRETLRSPRWGAAPLENPEVEKTDPRIAVAFIVGLAVVSLLVMIVGYGVGIWSLPV